MDVVTIDFETYYDDICTLKDLSVWEYLRHPDFKIHMCAIKVNDEASRVYIGTDIGKKFNSLNWKKVVLVAHNVSFDGAILLEFFGHVPAIYMDTLGMATYYDPRQNSYTLDACAQRYLGESKIAGVLSDMKGHKDLPPELLDKAVKYNNQDNELCYKLLKFFYPHVPIHERRLIHLTNRLSIIPRIRVNYSRAAKIYNAVMTHKQHLLTELGLSDEKPITSVAKFAKLLTAEGVVVPTKYSAKQKKHIPALAIDDMTLDVIAGNGNERVKTLIEARKQFSGNIIEVRVRRFIRASRHGAVPITLPLKYFGARNTGRFSGGSLLNGQNLPKEGGVRECLMAPEGFLFIIADYAAIEPRIAGWLARQLDLLELFFSGRDVYCEVGTALFGYQVVKGEGPGRTIAKEIVLGCIYGMGPDRLRATLRKRGIDLPFEQAHTFVYKFRELYNHIREFWYELDRLLTRGYVILPSGRKLTYPNIKFNEDGDKTFWNGKFRERIHGPKCCENVTQASAREVMGYHWIKLAEQGIEVVMNIHDEFVALAPISEAADMAKEMDRLMAIPPPFFEGLPLATELKINDIYLKA